MIEDNTIVHPETDIPSPTHYTGRPAVRKDNLPDCTQDIMIDFTRNYYQHFLTKPKMNDEQV